MNKLQQFEALAAGKTDLLKTLFRPILMHFAARFIGKNYAEFASDYRVLVEANLRCMEYFEMDMVGLISDPYRETAAFGAKIEYQKEAVPRCMNLIISSIDDVKALKNQDITKTERTLDRIKGAELFQKELKNRVPVIGWIEGPLAEACTLAGVNEMLMQLLMDADFSNLLLDKCVQTAKDFSKAQIEAGCHIIGMGDAICSQINPQTYETYVKERHKEIITYIHELGGMVKLHICGNITHLIPAIKDLHVDILDLDYQVDLDKTYQVVGPDVIRCGNINPVFIMESHQDEVYRLAEDLITKERGRKYILSAGCEISVLTPHEHLQSLSRAAKTFTK
jgi:MtaA/CmuA family methyltransferase